MPGLFGGGQKYRASTGIETAPGPAARRHRPGHATPGRSEGPRALAEHALEEPAPIAAAAAVVGGRLRHAGPSPFRLEHR